MPESSDPRTPYKLVQYEENYPATVENTYWHLARNRIFEENLRAAGARCILDVGCGRGILVQYLVSRGMDCYGVEPGEAPVPDDLRGRIFQGFRAQDLPEETRRRFDAIALGDVLEHLPEPGAFLVELRKGYPKLRTVLISVPARHELWSNYDEHFGHQRRYDLQELRQMVESAGGRVEHISYFFRSLYLPMRLILAIRGRRSTQLRGAVGGALIHRMAADLLVADYHYLPATVYGTSALCRAALPKDGIS